MIAIINYGLGNLTSVKNALAVIGVKNTITSNAEDLQKVDALILPGVGAAQEGMKNLKERNFIPLLKEEIKKGKPFLGICLGMQLLFTKSEEGNTNCLDIIKGTVKRFETKLKVPQTGWNTVRHSGKRSASRIAKNDGDSGQARMTYKNILFDKIQDNSYFYFVHSYYCDPKDKDLAIDITNYDKNFCSVVVQNNVYGVQFHPEKSGNSGLQLLKNFSEVQI